MAKRRTKRKRRQGKTRRRKQSRDRRQAADLRDPAPGYLYSIEEFHDALGFQYLRELFAATPEDEILRKLPPVRRHQTGRGRKPYARRALLRALVARMAYGIDSYRQLAVRLRQDPLLKLECGFELSRPSPDHTTLEKFAQLLGHHVDALDGGHAEVVDTLGAHLPGFGERTSWDSSYIPLLAPHSQSASGPEAKDAKRDVSTGEARPGGETAAMDPSRVDRTSETRGGENGAGPSARPRRSGPGKKRTRGKSRERKLWPGRGGAKAKPKSSCLQGDWGQKQSETVRAASVKLPDGRTVEGIEVKEHAHWVFGGKMHVIVDNTWNLPLYTQTTEASRGDCPMIVPMYQAMTDRHRWLECQYAMVDKAGDSTQVHKVLLEELGIVGIIPLREVANHEPPAQPEHAFAATVYDRERVTHMLDPRTGEYVEFEPWGYDASRGGLKYVCPCRRLRLSGDLAPDASCPFMGASCGARHGRWPFSFWVPVSSNYRYYCPVPRESKRWAELYKQRTTVERVNSVVKGPLGLGHRRLRSLTTAACEVALASVFLCARALVAARWGALGQVGSAVSELTPGPGHRATG